jgi:hypothetical protein
LTFWFALAHLFDTLIPWIRGVSHTLGIPGLEPVVIE